VNKLMLRSLNRRLSRADKWVALNVIELSSACANRRLTGRLGVGGSNPLAPTNQIKDLAGHRHSRFSRRETAGKLWQQAKTRIDVRRGSKRVPLARYSLSHAVPRIIKEDFGQVPSPRLRRTAVTLAQSLRVPRDSVKAPASAAAGDRSPVWHSASATHPLAGRDLLASRRRPDAPTKFLILEEVRVFQTNHSRE
jgi:hypothetical protein